MKMVKSLLLGSAAGLIAVAGAQAADLPVKAKAVEYVKICSLYGVGYYYIPGTDTCIKIGGYVRFEAYHNSVNGQYGTYANPAVGLGAYTRNANPFAMQARFRFTMDTRTQTEYGTLRSYFAAGMNVRNAPYETSSPGVSLAMERAFIQFAGFTIGRSDTFFAFYNGAAYGLVPMGLDPSSGPSGQNVFAYTWQFGNGLSATFSLEDSQSHNRGVVDLGNGAAAANTAGVYGGGIFAAQASDNQGVVMPDFVGNLRVDQAWGSAQLMGALKQVGARYTFQDNNITNCNANSGNRNTTACGYPDDEWGWAVGAGMTLKMPWDAKDTLSGTVSYAKGASSYVAFGMSNTSLHMSKGIAGGAFNDAVFGGTNGGQQNLELTTTFGTTVAFEHYWTPSLRTSWVFGYLNVEYSDAAKVLIANLGQRCVASGVTLAANNNNPRNCDPDWSMWRVASRTMWNPVQNLDVGLEIAYSQVDTAFSGATANLTAPAQSLARGNYAFDDEGVWSATVRVQRSFWP